MPKITIGIMGLHESLGRDYGVEEPYSGPSRQCVSCIALNKKKTDVRATHITGIVPVCYPKYLDTLYNSPLSILITFLMDFAQTS